MSQKKLKETEEKLKESMTDKYLVRKIKATKSKPQKISSVKPVPAPVQKFQREEGSLR